MRRAVTNVAVSCLFLTIAGRSAANVSVPFAESWPELESCILDIEFDLCAPFAAEGLWTPAQPAMAPGAGEPGIASSDPAVLAWPTVSTHPRSYPEHGEELSPNALYDLYRSNSAYAYVDLTDLGEISAIDGLTFQPAFPLGAILLGGVAVGLIGWSWRRRNLFFEEYP